MKNTIFTTWLTEIISALLILLFVYAAASKLLDLDKFRIQLGQSPLVTAFASWVAWVIPALEIFIAALLLSNKFRLPALYASFTLMLIFTGYIISIIKFSSHMPCSCGGVLEKMGWSAHLSFNILFTALAFIGVLLYNESNEKFLSNKIRGNRKPGIE